MEQIKERYIPENNLQGKRVIGFHVTNLIEGLIVALVVIIFINKIPFVPRVKLIIDLSVGLAITVIGGIGLHGRRYLSVLFDFFKYKPLIKQYHYRRMNYSPDKEELFEETTDGQIKVKTVYEKNIYQKAKHILKF